jgi:predicted Zn-dependent protease
LKISPFNTHGKITAPLTDAVLKINVSEMYITIVRMSEHIPRLTTLKFQTEFIYLSSSGHLRKSILLE